MIQDIEFSNINLEEKKLLIEILGYSVDEDGFVKKEGEPYICPLTDEEVYLENASVLPGSTIIINTTPLTLSEYFTKFVEKVAEDY